MLQFFAERNRRGACGPLRAPHDGEIYGAFRVVGRDWPGGAALSSQARAGCQARLTGYLNPQLDTSGMAESYAYPNQGAWAAGEHMVICEIRSTQGKLTGSVRASSPARPCARQACARQACARQALALASPTPP